MTFIETTATKQLSKYFSGKLKDFKVAFVEASEYENEMFVLLFKNEHYSSYESINAVVVAITNMINLETASINLTTALFPQPMFVGSR